MIDMTKLRKSSLGALLLAFLALGMASACSSTEEEESCDSSIENAEGCVQDLPI